MKKGELALTLIGRPGKPLKPLSNLLMMPDFIGFGNILTNQFNHQ